MKKLTKAEEQVIKYLWKLEKAFMKDILDAFPEPKPAKTTVSTLLNRMVNKGFVGFNQYSNVREYYPKVQKAEYFGNHINTIIKEYFNDSTAQFASFFTNQTKLSLKELEELKGIVEDKIKEENES